MKGRLKIFPNFVLIMKQVVQSYRTAEVKVMDVPPPLEKMGGALVKNAFSLISSGTERSGLSFAKKSLISKAIQRPDLLKKVFLKMKREGILSAYRGAREQLDSWVALGYSSAGVVLQSQDEEFKVGEKVACAGVGYASHAEIVYVPRNLCVRIPKSVSLEHGAFATVGAIALQGVRQAMPALGERILVIGLGLIGLLTVQILKANGCFVLGADLDPNRVRLAQELGADIACQTEQAGGLTEAFTRGYGADAVIITASTSSNEPIELAAALSRFKGRIVVVGAVGMNIPREPFYKKELELRLSMSYGPGRYDPTYEEDGLDYPFGYVRWTEKRNMEAFLDLLSQGKVVLDKLITHRVPIDEGTRAYDILTGKIKEPYIAILLTYPEEDLDTSALLEHKIKLPAGMPDFAQQGSKVRNVGVIGAGGFAKGVMLPALQKLGVNFKWIAAATGLTARSIGDKYHFSYATTDAKDLFSDPEIGSIFIFTRHNLHTPFVLEALKAGKAVFTEKPLSITKEQLSELEHFLNQQKEQGKDIPLLMVGFNRRFSSFALQLKDFFSNRTTPLVLNYRVNAGLLPRDSWIYDPSVGGGRIVGEVCHFIDFLCFLTEAFPQKISAVSMKISRKDVRPEDNVILSLEFSDGSVGEITYLSCGDFATPKEYIEVFGDGKTAFLNDFKELTLFKNGKMHVFKKRQDKGHLEELKRFFESAEGKSLPPFTLEHLLSVTRATFDARDQLLS
jgi:predicted dehydrogenase/threonine dehydrogenase-like Zn-dependent dehydrogenase